MKNRTIALGALIAVIGSGTVYGVYAQSPTPPTPPATGGKHEPHPEMNKGKKQLQAAKETLQKANKDFAGHRVKAIGLIDQAIKEIDAGIAADKQ